MQDSRNISKEINLRCKGTNGCVLHIPKQVLHSYKQMQLRIKDVEQYINYEK